MNFRKIFPWLDELLDPVVSNSVGQLAEVMIPTIDAIGTSRWESPSVDTGSGGVGTQVMDGPPAPNKRIRIYQFGKTSHNNAGTSFAHSVSIVDPTGAIEVPVGGSPAIVEYFLARPFVVPPLWYPRYRVAIDGAHNMTWTMLYLELVLGEPYSAL